MLVRLWFHADFFVLGTKDTNLSFWMPFICAVLSQLCCDSVVEQRRKLIGWKNNFHPPLLLKVFLPELVYFPRFALSEETAVLMLGRVQDWSKKPQLLGGVRGA